MTVPSDLPTNSYVGTGAANTFPFTFSIFLSSELSVTVVNSSTNISSDLVLGTDYTVTGLSPSGDPASSGSIVLVSSGQAWLSAGNLASGYTIVIQSDVPFGQSTSIRNQGDFYRSALENAMDRLAIQILQLQLAIDALAAGNQISQPGIVITDQVDGHTRQLVTVNGELGTNLLT